MENFPEAQAASEYLDSRLSKDSRDLFRFGYFPGMQNLAALTDMVGEKELRKRKLLYSIEIADAMCPRVIHRSFFENHPLVMPYRDAYGNAVSIVGRCLLPEAEMKEKKVPKYLNTEFKKGNFVFGLYENKQSILDQNCVYVVEGQFDVIKAVEKGFKNIVGLGSASMTPYQFCVINRYTDNIFLLLDNDEAGEKGRKRIIKQFGYLANIQNFYLPASYKDIDEYFTKSGEESVSFVVKG